MKSYVAAVAILFILPLTVDSQEAATETSPKEERVAADKSMSRPELIEAAVGRLIELQHDDGAWPYEGVYRVRGKIPVGYRIGGTAIACSSLISAKVADRNRITDSVAKGTDMILKELEHRLMKPTQESFYDVRIWGHIYALDYFSRLQKTEGFEELKSKTRPQIQKLVDAVVFQQTETGGWNYSNRKQHCCFVTSPAVHALMLAREAGAEVDDKVFERSLKTLKKSRQDKLIFPYIGTRTRRDTAPGSVARAPVSEATLLLLGDGDQEKLQRCIDAFHQHWDELEKRRKKTGTHKRPHGIAPYYFYYAHRYAALAIRMLPREKQEAEFEKFYQVLLKTKDDDNTWNDRVFEQSKAYGTSMSLLALSRDSVALPKPLESAAKKRRPTSRN